MYNEQAAIGQTLHDLTTLLANRPETSFEIIVVDDGSSDNSAAEVQADRFTPYPTGTASV
jgi:glycosyltransferase involved in cell wall biosynthesis